MLGHQISFLAFATARQALCNPPAESSPNPSDEAGLVAHPSVGGGDCISYGGVFEPFRGTRWPDFRREFYAWDDLEAGAGMDAPAFLPTGGHRSFSHSGLTGGRCVLAQGQAVPFYR
jgi:hypothetical protein